MDTDHWEVLMVSRGKTGKFYMELSNGDALRREPIPAVQASIIASALAQGQHLTATLLENSPAELAAEVDEEEE